MRAAEFPKALLHPSIADRVWIALARRELADAVFIAFRAVEESVRAAGGYAEPDIVVPLMRAAFNKEHGPPSAQSQSEGEREALAHLFTGAIGSYKSPYSHRTVTINDNVETQLLGFLS